MNIQELAELQRLLLQFGQLPNNMVITDKVWDMCKIVQSQMAKVPEGLDDYVSL